MVVENPNLAATLAHSIRSVQISDQSNWDSIIDHLGGSILQSWRWGEFKRLHGWEPVRLAVRAGDRPSVAAQVLIRSMGPFTVLYVPRGPATTPDVTSGELAAMTMAIDELATERRAVIAFLEPDDRSIRLATSGTLAWIQSQVELQPLRTIKVSVNRSDEELLEGMKSKTRYNIRLAGRRGVSVRAASIDEITDFYEVLEETSSRDEFGIHSIDYYADMLDSFGDDAVLLVAEYEDSIVAGAIILRHGDEAIYMFGASSRSAQRHMPTHLLQFEAMQWARERGCTLYDLWGIPPTDTPPDEASDDGLNVRSGLWGVYRFKQGFGGDMASYPGVYERVYRPGLVNLWRRFRPGPGA
jgi:peptidoglycan pentaglycine glycine transferase (the first glycine)